MLFLTPRLLVWARERCCALLNTAHHLRRALAEWGEQPVFLHLQFFRRRLQAAEAGGQRATQQQEESEEDPETTLLSLDQVSKPETTLSGRHASPKSCEA